MLDEVPHIHSNGTEGGWGEARGAWVWKSFMRKLGNESVIVFLYLPGMYILCRNSKVALAADMKRLQRRNMK